MGRYTHDLSQTTEAGGLFFGTAIPDIATTLTDVPGQVFVGQLTTTINSQMFNELSFQFSGNAISSEYGDNVKNRRDEYGLTIPEIYPENRNSLVPTIAVSGLSSIGANQLFDNKYRNYTLTDNLTWQRGEHQLKAGVLMAFEQKNELSTSATQGSFNYAAGGGYTAFQNFLRGNANGACGSGCTYTEPEREIGSQFRWQRYELYLQDSWRVNPRLRVDFGMRYSLQPPFEDENDLLTNFMLSRYDRANAPQFTADASRLVAGHRRPAQRHRAGRHDLAVRPRRQRNRQEQLPAAARLLLRRDRQRHDGRPRRLGHLLRPAADRASSCRTPSSTHRSTRTPRSSTRRCRTRAPAAAPPRSRCRA